MIYLTVFQSLIIFKVIYPTLPLAYVTGLKKPSIPACPVGNQLDHILLGWGHFWHVLVNDFVRG